MSNESAIPCFNIMVIPVKEHPRKFGLEPGSYGSPGSPGGPIGYTEGGGAVIETPGTPMVVGILKEPTPGIQIVGGT
jgi:hypothetical protein